MDTTLMKCPTCGHSVSRTVEACTYCGTAVSEGEQTQQFDENALEAPISAEPTPPLHPEDPPPVVDMPAESGGAPAAVSGHPEPTPSDQSPIGQPMTESAKPAAKAASIKTGPEAELELSGQDQAVESKPKVKPEKKQVQAGNETVLTALAKPTVVPTAGPGTAVESQPEVKAPAGEEARPAVSARPVAQKQVKPEAAAERPAGTPEPAAVSAPETMKPSVEPVTEIKAEDQAVQPAAPIPSEISGDTIILTPDAEVQPAEKVSPAEAEVQVTAEAIKKQTEAQAAAETLKTQKAAQDKAALLKKQKAALAKAEVVKRQKAVLAKAEAIKTQKTALAKTEVSKKRKRINEKGKALPPIKAASTQAQALNKQKEAQATIEAPKKENAAATIQNTEDSHPTMIHGLPSNTKIIGLLKKYEGQAIGINYDNSAEIREAKLVKANDEFFSVFVKDKEQHYNYPLKTILTIIEGKDGVDAGDSEQKLKFNAVIKVYPLLLF